MVTRDFEDVKVELNIPDDMWSCHTSIVGGYYVEGHVPVEAIQKLLRERPEIDGIGLPGMPQGSPGMSGTKSGPWVIYAISGNAVEEFMTI